MDRFSEIVRRLAESAQQFAEHLGGPGLVAIAFLDSSFLTLPEVADLLVVVLTIREPDQWMYFAAMTTTGSVAGCYALYVLGRKGGEALVRRGFHERHIDRALDWFRRHGAPVLVVPALLPPPMPFKVFVLMAGVAGLRTLPFLLAIVVGRGVRYGALAWLARWYGRDVVWLFQHRALDLFWPFVVLSALAAGGWWVWRRFQRPAGPPPTSPDVAAGADVE